MSSRRLAVTLCSVAAFATLATACGDDPAPAAAAGDTVPAAALPDDLPAAGGTGTGSIVVGVDTFAFDADVCSLEPASHLGRKYDLYVHGEGSNGDQTYAVSVYRSVSDDGNRVEALEIVPGAGELIAATNVVPVGQTSDLLAVSGSLLSGEMAFVATGDDDAAIGRVDLTCS